MFSVDRDRPDEGRGQCLGDAADDELCSQLQVEWLRVGLGTAQSGDDARESLSLGEAARPEGR